MKKILCMIVLFVCGCWNSSTSGDLSCLTCRDVLAGSNIFTENLCNGTIELWSKIEKVACFENSQCASECESLCKFEGISQNCEACLLLPKSRQDYLNCDMVGSQ